MRVKKNQIFGISMYLLFTIQYYFFYVHNKLELVNKIKSVDACNIFYCSVF